MRVLFLTQWYWPEPLTYQCDLAETLQAQGHEVTVLTGFPNWPTGRLAPGYRIRLVQRETIRGVPVVRVPLYPDHSRSPWGRVFNFASLAGSTTALGPLLVPRCDVVHCNFPPVTLGGPAWLLSRLMRAPMTFETQDIWPETLEAANMLRNRRALDLVNRGMLWGYRRAAAIRVISPGFRDHLAAKGIPAEKIHVISNWVDTERYQPREPDPQLAEELGLAGHFNVMYAGTIGLVQGLETVIDAAAELASELPAVQFVLIGDGADLERLQGLAARRGLTNVRFLGRVSPERISRIYPLADVLWVNISDAPLFRITIPHKIFAYMASGKPVLAGIAGDAAAVIIDAQAGLACRPGDPRDLANAVRRFYRMTPEQRHAMGLNGRRAMLECYGRERLVERTAQMLRSAIESHMRRRTQSAP